MHSEQFSHEKFFETEYGVAGSALSAQTVPDQRGGVAGTSPGAWPNKWLHQERLAAGTKPADRDRVEFLQKDAQIMRLGTWTNFVCDNGSLEFNPVFDRKPVQLIE